MMIHTTAIISPLAKIDNNVEIGPYTIIHDNVHIGENSKIGAFCEIGLPTPLAINSELTIGSHANIRSHSIIYIGSKIGSNLQTGHHICIRENSYIAEGVQIGSRSDIQGDCSIGQYTRMHADVHVGKNSNIGSYVWLFPEVLLTNDAMPPSDELIGPIIDDYCVLASKVLVFPGVHIGQHAVVSAASVVKQDVAEWKLVSGNPAKSVCDSRILRMPNNPKQKAYPWTARFHRGYPSEIIQQWIDSKDLK